LIAWLIVSGWQDLFRRKRRLSKRDMVGCLNVVIESAETRMRSPQGRRYLKYLKRFLKRAGVTIRAEPLSELEGEEEAPGYDLERMSLAKLGELLLSEIEIAGLGDAFESREVQVVDIRAQAEPGEYPCVVDSRGEAPSQYGWYDG